MAVFSKQDINDFQKQKFLSFEVNHAESRIKKFEKILADISAPPPPREKQSPLTRARGQSGYWISGVARDISQRPCISILTTET
jgi:hypothetical protein